MLYERCHAEGFPGLASDSGKEQILQPFKYQVRRLKKVQGSTYGKVITECFEKTLADKAETEVDENGNDSELCMRDVKID